MAEHVMTTGGNKIRIEEVDYYLGRFYIRGSHKGPALREPGELACGVTVVRYLGYRHKEDGRVSCTPFYVVRCPCGVEGPRQLNRSREGAACWVSCSRAARPLCKWCGVTDRSLFRVLLVSPNGGGGSLLRTCCMACDRIKHRGGTFPCGKPRRALAIQRDDVDEHLCERCEPWPRRRSKAERDRERYRNSPARREACRRYDRARKARRRAAAAT